MRIKNNQSASFALRYTSQNRSVLLKSLEKLSSGYAINRAGDNAAGLIISEKMRRQITALKRADQNSREGTKLIQVGEGALDEVHGMLQRAAALASQSANGVYEDAVDREALQAELDQLCEDIDRIAENVNFNGVKLFQNRGLEYEQKTDLVRAVSDARQAAEANLDSLRTPQVQTETQPQVRTQTRTLDDLIRAEDKGELNIVYIEDSFTTTQTAGTPPADGITHDPNQDKVINGKKISEILQTEIIPNTVDHILANYSAFKYLTGSTIGIGLRLYSDPASSVLASVTLEGNLTSDGKGTLGYMLSVNMGQVDPTKSDWREELEATIAHEMIHAFMDEAATAGMLGKLPGSGALQSPGRFEKWFIEGMAQTASGPGNWIHPGSLGGLRIDENSTNAQIAAQIQAHQLDKTDTKSDVNYGTGYLACMYLGWAIASGGNASTPVTAKNISDGLNSLLSAVIGGKSLDTAIRELTNNKFTGTAGFVSKFNTDGKNAAGSEVTNFIHNLMVAKGLGRGGLVSGNLADTDLTVNTAHNVNDIKLFKLDTTKQMVDNQYPSDYVVLTGGTTSIGGTAPSDFIPVTTSKLFTVTGGVEGADYEYQGNTLVIKTNKVTAVTNAAGAGSQGSIKIADNVGKVNLTLNGVDCSGNTQGSGFDLGTGNTVTLKLADGTNNVFKGAGTSAGISVGTGTKLTIDGDTGKLDATGSGQSAGIGTNANSNVTGASITINGGTINATSGNSGAGIGAGCSCGSNKASAFGNITINGGRITAKSMNEGAGIGGALGSSVGKITITGGTINAESTSHGAGIGGGHNAYNGDITISGGTIKAVSKYHGTGIGAGCSSNTETKNSNLTITGNAVIRQAQGGDLGAGMGASWCGNWGNIEISGNATVESAVGGTSGSGIGSGSEGGSHVGNILINTTGKVCAQGGRNGVGIGSGQGQASRPSECGNIEIKKGTVEAVGGENSTGIGAGRGSTSGNITIGDTGNPNSKVIVTARGGMSYNGANILAYSDKDHKTPGTLKIVGSGTTVRPGEEGEGLYSTSGAMGEDNRARFSYPVYLFHTDKNSGKDETLNAGVGLNAATSGKLPLDKDKIDLSSIKITDEEGNSWTPGLSHDPLNSDYVFVWLRPRNQTLTLEYKMKGSHRKQKVELDLIYHPEAGVFRLPGQAVPPKAVPPGYDGKPGDMAPPRPDWDPEPPYVERPREEGEGIILQIGAEYGETLTVPQFYLSLDALELGDLDISTQLNAWESMPVIQDAINRVSSIRATYGALYNRLEHNQGQLQHMVENITDAESRIRDTDMAEEMMVYTKASILSQSAQAMLSQAAQQPRSVLQLLG